MLKIITILRSNVCAVTLYVWLRDILAQTSSKHMSVLHRSTDGIQLNTCWIYPLCDAFLIDLSVIPIHLAYIRIKLSSKIFKMFQTYLLYNLKNPSNTANADWTCLAWYIPCIWYLKCNISMFNSLPHTIFLSWYQLKTL